MPKYVCADCGHEQDTFQHCERPCGSGPVVLISTCDQILGPNWRKECFPGPRDPLGRVIVPPDPSGHERGGPGRRDLPDSQ